MSLRLNECINRLVSQKAEFAIYKDQNDEKLHIIIPKFPSYNFKAVSDLLGHKCFLLSPFFMDGPFNGVALPYDRSIHIGQLDAILSQERLPRVEHECLVKQDDSFERYDSDFNVFHEALVKNEFEKLVLTYMEKHELKSTLGDIFVNACRKYKHAFVYMMYTKDSGLWFGATPEILCTFRGDKMTTMALAGTMKKDPSGIYEWSDKNRSEQAIVGKYLYDSLLPICDNVRMSEAYTQEAGPVVHLRSDITCNLRPGLMDKLIRVMHPTPAVCGMPKQQALDFIKSKENMDRLYYAGFIGPLDSLKRKASLFVNLRSMYVYNNNAYLFSGSGLMKESDHAEERKEIETKLNTLTSLL